MDDIMLNIPNPKKCKKEVKKLLKASVSSCSNPFCLRHEDMSIRFGVCSNCNIAKYCSYSCQCINWHDHKHICHYQNGVLERLKRAFMSYRGSVSSCANATCHHLLPSLIHPLMCLDCGLVKYCSVECNLGDLHHSSWCPGKRCLPNPQDSSGDNKTTS